MVIKGGSVSGAARFAAHLQRTDTNEIRNEVIEMRDVAATDLRGALREMEAVARPARIAKNRFIRRRSTRKRMSV